MVQKTDEVLTALLESINSTIERKVAAVVPVEVKRQLELRELPQQYLTRRQVCENLDITLPTLHRLMRDGKLPFIKVGASTRFPREDFDQAVRSGGLKKYGRR